MHPKQLRNLEVRVLWVREIRKWEEKGGKGQNPRPKLAKLGLTAPPGAERQSWDRKSARGERGRVLPGPGTDALRRLP